MFSFWPKRSAKDYINEAKKTVEELNNQDNIWNYFVPEYLRQKPCNTVFSVRTVDGKVVLSVTTDQVTSTTIMSKQDTEKLIALLQAEVLNK